MLYLFNNCHLEAEERIFDFGTIYQLGLGEVGRGRKFMALTCPEGTILERGINKDLSVGTTKSGKPKIIVRKDNNLYLMLSSAGGYTRRGNGFIQVLQSQKELFQVLAWGNGADGDAGRIGTWDCLLLQVIPSEEPLLLRVRTSGAGYGTPSDMLVINDSIVYHCYPDELSECEEQLEIDLPCSPILSEDDLNSSDEWVTL